MVVVVYLDRLYRKIVMVYLDRLYGKIVMVYLDRLYGKIVMVYLERQSLQRDCDGLFYKDRFTEQL